MAEASNPFNRMTVLALILVGSLAFLGFLYGLGSGDFGQQDNNGEAHGASDSVIGYTALYGLLQGTGANVSLGRTEASFDDRNLLIIAPPFSGKGEEIAELIEKRRFSGPTIIIMPKWFAMPDNELQRGWVRLAGAKGFQSFQDSLNIESEIDGGGGLVPFQAVKSKKRRGTSLTSAFGAPGSAPEALATLKGKDIVAMVRDGKTGKPVAGYLDQGGEYSNLDGLAARAYNKQNTSYNAYPTILVADPDLFNNMGMADKSTALHALSLISAVDDGLDLPIVFDLTFNGLGRADNLLTLAFRPPFLAATLCFLIAAIIIGWQTFVRFAPAVSGERSINFGKTALVHNSAAMLKLMARQHLLREPYLAMIRRQAARKLGLSPSLAEAELTAHLDKASSPDKPPFSVLENKLKRAKTPQDITHMAAQLDMWKKENL